MQTYEPALKEQLRSEFEMKDPGPSKKILGVNLIRNRKKGILFSYTGEIYLESTW